MYTLYHFPFSQHGRRVIALLEAAELPYRVQHIAMDKGEHHSPAYLAINPNHQVPTLVDGDLVIHESNAILRYLCIKHSLSEWYPSDPARRASVDQWLDWNQCRFSPAVIDIVLNRVFLGPEGDAAAIVRGEQRLTELAPILESGLSEKPFLTGDTPTIADLSVSSNVTQLGLAGATPTSPAITGWMQRLGDIPAVRFSNQALQPQPA